MTRLAHTCPSDHELSRAFSETADARLSSHLRTCARCSAEWTSLEQLATLGAALPASPASSLDREELRTEILSRAATAPRASAAKTATGWRPLTAVAIGAAAAIAFVVWSLPDASRAPAPAGRASTVAAAALRATVSPAAGARFERLGAQPDETVRLVDGTLDVEVARLGRGERFRVLTADAEVEVRGTRFQVTAARGQLLLVHVTHGRVEVRQGAGPTAVLGVGEDWTRANAARASVELGALDRGSPAVAVVAASLRSTPRVQPVRALPAVAGPVAPTGAEQSAAPVGADVLAFDEGWTALRAGDASAAAEAFDRAMSANPRGPIAEDASFWHALALGRAGRRASAAQAFASFLGRFEASARAGEASAMLGWLLLEDGDLAGAERRFAAARDDSVPAVSSSARAGLEEIARRRQAR